MTVDILLVKRGWDRNGLHIFTFSDGDVAEVVTADGVATVGCDVFDKISDEYPGVFAVSSYVRHEEQSDQLSLLDGVDDQVEEEPIEAKPVSRPFVSSGGKRRRKKKK